MPAKKSAAKPSPQAEVKAAQVDAENDRQPTAAQADRERVERRKAAGRCVTCGLFAPYGTSDECRSCIVGETLDPRLDEFAVDELGGGRVG